MDTSYKLFQRKQLERKMLSHHSMDKKPANIHVEKDEIKYNYVVIKGLYLGYGGVLYESIKIK